MAHSSQAHQTTETNLIDVEADVDKSEKMIKLLRSQCIYIPERYYVKMAQKGLLDRFVNLIERESTKNNHVKELLDKHRIIIPAEFYPQLLQTDLFQGLLDIVHDVNRDKEIERANFIKYNLYSTRKRSHDSITDNDSEQDKTQADIDEQSRKIRKDNPIGTIDSAPPTNSVQNQNEDEDSFLDQLD